MDFLLPCRAAIYSVRARIESCLILAVDRGMSGSRSCYGMSGPSWDSGMPGVRWEPWKVWF